MWWNWQTRKSRIRKSDKLGTCALQRAGSSPALTTFMYYLLEILMVPYPGKFRSVLIEILSICIEKYECLFK